MRTDNDPAAVDFRPQSSASPRALSARAPTTSPAPSPPAPDARDESRAEGREEGRAEGLAEGRTKGRTEGLAEGRTKGRTEGLAEGRTEGRAKTVRELLRLRGIAVLEGFPANAPGFAEAPEEAAAAAALACDSEEDFRARIRGG